MSARATVLAALAAGLGLCGAAGGQELTLGRAARMALETHPAAAAAEARSSAALADVGAARSAYLPTLTGTLGLTRFEEPMVVAPLHGFDPTRPPDFDRTLVQSQVNLEYTIFEGGARRARADASEARSGAAAFGATGAHMTVLEAVARAYVGALAAREVRVAARHQVEALAAESSRARQRLDEGVAARVEVLRAEAAELDARAQLAAAEAGADVAERALARVIGLDPDALSGRALADVRVTDGAALGDDVEDPRVSAMRRALDGARALLSQQRAGRLPTLRASAGLMNYGSGAGDFVTEWQTGLRVSWPIFTGGARGANIERAQAEVLAAEADLRAAELDAARAVDGAHADLVAARSRAQALEASVAQWEEVTRIEALGLETGVGAQQDYLRAEAALYLARAGYARARYDQVLARVAEARARGGLDEGWLDAAVETVR